MRHQVGVGDQHPRRVGVGLEHADRLAGLYQQGLVVVQLLEGLDDPVVALPVARGTADAAVNHQFPGVLRDLRVEVVHQHAQRRFGQPALGGQRSAARGAISISRNLLGVVTAGSWAWRSTGGDRRGCA